MSRSSIRRPLKSIRTRQSILGAAISPIFEMVEARSLFSAAPTAVISPISPLNEGQTVLVSGLNSADSDGTVATYQWDTNYSAGRGFHNRVTGSTFTFHADSSGTQNIALRVIDNTGDVSAVTTATINIADIAPTITLTAPNSTNEASSAAITWSYTDPGTNDAVNNWSVDWGDQTTSSYAGTATAGSHVYDEDGSYTITLTATQTDAVTSVTHAITVNNVTPIVNATTTTPTLAEGEIAQVDFTSPNRGSTLSGWSIDWGDGNQDQYSNQRSHATHVYADNGNYAAIVTAQEIGPGSGSSTVNYNVTNVAPDVTQTGVPTTGLEGTAITVGSTVSDAGVLDTETYGWSVYRNGQHFILPGNVNITGQSFTFTPTDNGNYAVRLTVIDNDGGSTTINSTSIVVANVNPTATITGTPGAPINEGAAVNLTAVPIDAGSEDTFTYAWSVTKGGAAYTSGLGATNAAGFTFTPNDNGSYIATVVVTDDDGGFVSASTAAITVLNVAPVATVTAPTTANEGDTVSATSTVTDAGTADTQSYAWSVEKQTGTGSGTLTTSGTGRGELSTFNWGSNFTITSRMSVASTSPDGLGSLLYDYANAFTVGTGSVNLNVSKSGGHYSIALTDDSSNSVTTPLDPAAFGTAFDLAVSYDGSTGATSIYIDGVSVASGTLRTGLGGSMHTHFAERVAGTFDQFGFYRSTLTAQDAADLHNNIAIVATPADIWNFDNAIGSNATTGINGTPISSFTNPVYSGPLSTWSAYALPGGLSTSGSTFGFVPVDNGTYRINLAVTDNDGGAVTSHSSNIVVANVAPTGNITGDATGNEGATLNYSVAVTDAGAIDTQSYLWSVTKGGVNYTSGLGATNGSTFGFTPNDNAAYVVSVAITDNDGGTTTATSNVTVANVAPTATITGTPSGTTPEGTAIVLGSTVTDPGSLDTQTYLWSVTKGSAAYTTGLGATNTSGFTFTPNDNGSYVVSLQVTDNNSGTSTISTSAIVVANVAPTGTISGEPGAPINEGDTVALTAAGADVGSADVAGLTYVWTIKKDGVAWTPLSGTVLNTAALSFVPTDNGTYIATVAITDKDTGTVSVDSAAIVANNVAPTSVITGIASPVSGTANIGLNGSTLGMVRSNGTVALNQTYPEVGRANGVNEHLIMKFALPAGMTVASITGATLSVNHTLGLSPANGFDLYAFASTNTTVVAGDLTDSAPGNATLIASNFAANSGGASISGTALENAIKAALNAGQTSVNFAIRDPNNGGIYVIASPGMGGAPNLAISTTTTVTSPEGTPLALGATTTDAGVADTQSYAWSVTKGGVAVDLTGITANAATFNFTPRDNGAYVISLATTDDDLGTSTTTKAITITNVAPAPVITGNSTVNEDHAISFSVAANDPGLDDTQTYLWSVTKGGVAYTTGLGATNASSFSFTPNLFGTYIVSAQVTDNDGGTATVTKTITVANVAPTVAITGGIPSGPIGEGTSVTLTGTGTDASGETGLVYSWGVTRRNGQTFALPNGTVTNAQTFTFIPTDNANYRVTLAVTDSGGLTGSVTTSNIVVTNALPAATISGMPGGPITEGTPVSLAVAAADPGAEDSLGYLWTVTKDGVAYTLPNGTDATHAAFTFTPNDNGSWIATCVVTDNDGGPTTVTSGAMTVTNVAPTVTISRVLGSGQILEGSSNVYAANVVDPGSADTFTYAWTATKDSQPYTLSGTTTGANLTFVPIDQGTYVLSVLVTDKDTATGTSSTANISVNNANPALSHDTVATSGTEGVAFSLDALATDPGVNDVLTYTWTIQKPDATTTTVVGALSSYTPADNGTYYAQVTVTDADGGTITGATHTIAVANVAPVITSVTAPTTGTEGSAITATVAATDVVADTISYNWSVTRNNGDTYNLPNGVSTIGSSFTFTPTNNGTYVLNVTASDEDGGITTQQRTIVVSNVAPVAAITGGTTGDEGSAITLGSTVTDIGSEDTTAGFTYLWSVTKDGAAYTTGLGATNTASFAFTPNDQGTYIATLVAKDQDNVVSNTTTQTITIANVAPVASITGTPSSATNEGSAIALTGVATDVGPIDVLTYSWSVTKDGQSYLAATTPSATGQAFSFTPTDNGSYIATLTVNDGTVSTVATTTAMTVNNVAPSATIAGPTTSNEGSSVTMTAAGTDAGSDDVSSLTYAWSVTKDTVAVDLTGLTTNAAAFTYTPADQGAYVFSVIVTDKDSGTSTLTHSVAVANIAPAVAITGASTTGTEGTAITVGSTATDAGVNDVLTYGWSVYKDGQHYTLPNGTTIDGTGLTFTPSDNGSYVIRLTVNDADTGTTTVNSSAITVANVAPTAAITGATTGTEGAVVTLGSTASDVSSDDLTAGLTYGWTAKRGNTTVATGNNASFAFTPAVHGTHVVTLAVTDKDGSTTTTSSSIVVANTPPANVGITGSLNGISEGDAVALTATASDVSGDPLTYAWQVLRGSNVFAQGTGTDVDFTAARGNYSIVVTATDSAGAATSNTTALTVANIAPTGQITPQPGVSLLTAGVNFGVAIGDVPVNSAMSVIWDFGDGTTSSNTYTGNQTVIKKHTYAARGTYNVSATVNDGASSTVVNQTVTVSEAAVLADPMDPTKTALFVTGGDANDTIAVTQQSNGKYGVTFNGTVLGTNYAPAGRVYVYGNGGSNNITVSGSANAVIFAGVTASTVTGGSGNDVIIGSAVSDKLSGGAGRDIIVGGAGADNLHGNEGEDMIVATTLSKMNDVTSMVNMMTKWGDPTASFASRRIAVKNLFASNALISDAGNNQVYGEAGNDWFLVNTSTDHLRDVVTGDVTN